MDLHCKATADPSQELIYVWKRFGNTKSLNRAKQHLSLSYSNCKVHVAVGFEERLEFFKNGRISDDAYLV